MPMAEDAFGRGDIQPFSQRRQDFADPLRWSLEPIERRVAAGREGRATGLAAKGLDAFTVAMCAVADEGMDLGVGDAVVSTGGSRTRKAGGDDPLRLAPPALQFAPRANGWRWC